MAKLIPCKPSEATHLQVLPCERGRCEMLGVTPYGIYPVQYSIMLMDYGEEFIENDAGDICKSFSVVVKTKWFAVRSVGAMEKNKRLTDEELTAIRERAKKATEAPWGVDVPIEVCSECKNEYEIVESSVFLAPIVAESKRGEDAAFIAHAREDIPKLLAEIERLRELLNKAFEYGTSSDAYRDEKVVEELYEYLYGGDDE